MKGKASAKAASKAGFTKGEQFVRVSEKVLLIDTPGVLSGEKEEELMALMGVVNAEKIADPEGAAFVLIDYIKEEMPGRLNGAFGVDESGDSEEILEGIAVVKKKTGRGGKPDTKTAAMMLSNKWQKGAL